MRPTSEIRTIRWPTIAWLAVLIAVHLGLAYDILRQKSPTVDEVAHLPAGLSYWEKHSFRVYPQNPPLAKLWATLFVGESALARNYAGVWQTQEPPNHWRFAFEFLEANAGAEASRAAYRAVFTEARLRIALISATAIPLLYLWGRWWFGEAAGWLASLLWTLSPNMLAHAGLVTTDLPVTVAGLSLAFAFARWSESPTWSRALFVGFLLGVANLVKFSALLWIPLLLCWGSLVWMRRGGWSSLRAIQMGVGAGLALFVLNLGYGFERVGEPLGDFPFVSRTLSRSRLPEDGPPSPSLPAAWPWTERINRMRGTPFENLPVPLPYYYLLGFDDQKFEAEGKYQMYLRGEMRRTGWTHYFVYALALKVPLSTWLLATVAAFRMIRKEAVGRRAVLVLLFAAPVAVMTFLTDIDLGLRYVLPALPFLYLFAGSALATGAGSAARILAGLAILWNSASIAYVHPHEFSYFECYVGPKNGRFHLIDSNIDWGQDLRGLSVWLRNNPEWRNARLAYWGTIPPEFEGITDYRLAPRLIDFESIPPDQWLPSENPDDPTTFGPQPGRYVVSVNFERGMRFHSPTPLDLRGKFLHVRPSVFLPGSNGMLLDLRGQPYFEYFRHFPARIEPDIGYSLLLYDISIAEANRVRKLLGLPLLEDEDERP